MDATNVTPTTDTACQRCASPGTHLPCCSSHGVMLCCACYRRTHFVEVRPCCGTDARALETHRTVYSVKRAPIPRVIEATALVLNQVDTVHNSSKGDHSPACQAAGAYRSAATCLCARPLPPCELLELEPPCEVCDDTGEVSDAPGRYGRQVQPCTNCDAYDRQQQLLADQYLESRED